MKGIELLEKYPKAAEVIIQYYADEFLKAVEASDVSEEFKEFSRQQRIDDQYVADFIDNNPRGTFDVFDANGVYIEISVDVSKANALFAYVINGDIMDNVEGVLYNNRKEAEVAAVEKAFEILNDKLCQTK